MNLKIKDAEPRKFDIIELVFDYASIISNSVFKYLPLLITVIATTEIFLMIFEQIKSRST